MHTTATKIESRSCFGGVEGTSHCSKITAMGWGGDIKQGQNVDTCPSAVKQELLGDTKAGQDLRSVVAGIPIHLQSHLL